MKSDKNIHRCCFTCRHWEGNNRKRRGYCRRLNLANEDAPGGNSLCCWWAMRPGARMTGAKAKESTK